MAEVCPTITAFNPHQYRQQMELVGQFAERIHIDLMDGIFAPTRSPGYKQTWWQRELICDIHVMYEHPLEAVEYLVEQRPHLVIIHIEAEAAEVEGCLKLLGKHRIKRGLALLPDSQPADFNDWLKRADHCLVFSGKLGYHGGQADLDLLKKIPQIQGINPNLEIGWDGGANDTNAVELIEAGIDVLNVGGFIHKAERPKEAYAILQQIANT